MAFISNDTAPGRTAPPDPVAGFRFAAMPNGSWWIRWLGDVAFHERHITSRQPTISVVLQNAEPGREKELETIRLTVSQLCAARVGSLWRNKVVTDQVMGEEREISFDAKDFVQTVAGATTPQNRFGDDGFMLPYEAHVFHREHTKAPCLAGWVDTTCYVIPSTELIRFYFGSSGGLLRRLFSANFDADRLVTEQSLMAGHLTIGLPHDLGAASAHDVARILLSPEARLGATQVGRSLVAGTVATQGKDPVYAQTRLPFSGRTTLRVRGVELQGPEWLKRFLVQEILSCAAPFPFQSVRYSCTTKAKPAPGWQGAQPGDARANPSVASSRGKPTQVGNADPSKASASRTVYLGRDVRFPDLVNKPARRVDIATPAQMLVRMLPPSPLDGSGEGTGRGTGRPLDLSLQPDARPSLPTLRCPDKDWAPFFQWLTRLAGEPWVEKLSFVRIHPGQARSHWAQLPEIVTDEGEVLEETRIRVSPVDRDCCRRLASFANLQVKGRLSGLLSLHPWSPTDQNVVHVWPSIPISEVEALRAVVAACTGDPAVGPPRRIGLSPAASFDAASLGDAVQELHDLLVG
ncbi:hypothetical protein [Piscinibacter sp. HJYY11]|uniref:hypothetical protein n=1 Tax=Piscinibacter sp. HJYY11 TaxID=2801333 RepID=UPI00191CD6A9|nr:hypothetical protein [Piscinibacter sp. HJYY11]MBL0729442.1 hypothetical protein [Piscinibacter sp. HJYY11]